MGVKKPRVATSHLHMCVQVWQALAVSFAQAGAEADAKMCADEGLKVGAEPAACECSRHTAVNQSCGLCAYGRLLQTLQAAFTLWAKHMSPGES